MNLNQSSSRLKYAGVFLLLFCGWLLGFLSQRGTSVTADEANHFDSSRRFLEGSFEYRSEADTGKTPANVLNVLAARLLKPHADLRCPSCHQYEAVLAGRQATMLAGVLLGLLIFLWTESFYGTAGGFLALFLFTFSPLVLAHRRYVTTDLYAALIFFASFYSLWSYERKGGVWRGLRTAFLIGISLLVKYSLLLIFPTVLFLLFSQKRGLSALKHAFSWMVIFIFVSLLILNGAFRFQKTLKTWNSIKYKSQQFQKLRSLELPVPLPQDWLQHLDQLLYFESIGKTYGPLYLLGKFQETDKKGFKGYFFWAYLLKEPIAAQILLLLALIFYVKNSKKFDFWKNEVFLFLPFLVFTAHVNYFLRMQTGLRYALPVFPFLYVFTGSLLKEYDAVSPKIKMAVAGLLLYFTISVMSYSPYFLAYFNELVWDRSQAYKYLLGNNLAWGIEQYPSLQHYLADHPRTHINPREPVSGTVIFDIRDYYLSPRRDKMKWFLDHYRPVKTIGYAYWIYEIKDLK